MKDLYELWSTKQGEPKLVGSYSAMSALLTGWTENTDEQPLIAKASVGEGEVIINDLMPATMRTDLTSAEVWNNNIIENAVYFTAVRFLGVGQYERHERLTLESTEGLAKVLAKENKANYMIYAVNARGNATWVKNIMST